MPTPITAGLTRRVDHHACRQRSDRSTAQPPRYPSSAPTPGRSEGWPITTACMVCAVRSRASRVARRLRSPGARPATVGAWAFTCRRPPAGRQPGVRSRLGKHRPPARCGQPRRLPGGTTAELSGKPTVNAHRVPERALRQAPAITSSSGRRGHRRGERSGTWPGDGGPSTAAMVCSRTGPPLVHRA